MLVPGDASSAIYTFQVPNQREFEDFLDTASREGPLL